MDTAFTARNVAKWVTTSVVAIKTAELAAETVSDYTRFEEDDLVVNLGSKCFGWFVSSRLEPVTDAMVDKTADFLVAQWDKRRTKKDTENEEK
jgi:hypothetical protein